MARQLRLLLVAATAVEGASLVFARLKLEG